jgi:hypothetical protein
MVKDLCPIQTTFGRSQYLPPHHDHSRQEMQKRIFQKDSWRCLFYILLNLTNLSSRHKLLATPPTGLPDTSSSLFDLGRPARRAGRSRRRGVKAAEIVRLQWPLQVSGLDDELHSRESHFSPRPSGTGIPPANARVALRSTGSPRLAVPGSTAFRKLAGCVRTHPAPRSMLLRGSRSVSPPPFD